MKPLIIQFSLIIFLTSSAIGQSSSLKDSLRSYYENIMFAEQSIIESKIDSGVIFYNRASSFHQPFLTDAYNASMASIGIDDLKSTMKYIKIMVAKGISVIFFK